MEVKNLRVLVAENNPFERESTERKLRSAGVTHVIVVTNGKEALRLVRDYRFDILITDLTMPEMDGMRLMHHLRHERACPRILVVSRSDSALLRAAKKFAQEVNLRIHDCVAKPLSDADLIEVLLAAACDERQRERSVEDTRAIEADSILNEGYLFAMYQPKMSIATNMMIGVEALARVRHHLYGDIAPGMLLPKLLECGQMGALTYGMLHLAVKDQKKWFERGHDIPISVNVPVSVIEQEDSVDRLVYAVVSAGGDPAGVILEITETCPVTDFSAFYYATSRARLAGFGLAVDDFGTGYSSLERLVNGPFTELKIDRAFVHGAARSNEIRTALDYCARIGANLGMTVTAEGVESVADLTAVCRSGCDLVQGFLLSRPAHAEIVPTLACQRLW